MTNPSPPDGLTQEELADWADWGEAHGYRRLLRTIASERRACMEAEGVNKRWDDIVAKMTVRHNELMNDRSIAEAKLAEAEKRAEDCDETIRVTKMFVDRIAAERDALKTDLAQVTERLLSSETVLAAVSDARDVVVGWLDDERAHADRLAAELEVFDCAPDTNGGRALAEHAKRRGTSNE